MLKKWLKRAFFELVALGLVALVVGFTYNGLSPRGIAISSTYPKLRGEREIEPPQIDLTTAFSYFTEGALFLDAREPDEFYLGHIYGAKNLPYEELDQYVSLLDSIPKDTLIVTYCDGEGCELSIHLARELIKRGYKNVYAFYAGWRKWETANYPVDVGR